VVGNDARLLVVIPDAAQSAFCQFARFRDAQVDLSRCHTPYLRARDLIKAKTQCIKTGSTSHNRNEKNMAEADLDTLIRSVAKKQVKVLVDAAKKRHGRLMGQAAKAKDKDAKARFKDLARNTLELAAAAARRLEITADNAADSYMRSIKRVIEEQAVAKAEGDKAASEQAAKEKAAKEKATKEKAAKEKAIKKAAKAKPARKTARKKS
jgi:hypothetical protein